MATKSFIINHIAVTLAITKKEAAFVYSAVEVATFDSLAHYGVAVIPGVGRLKLKHRVNRVGHNPKTGTTISIAARNVFKFSPSKSAKEKVNG